MLENENSLAAKYGRKKSDSQTQTQAQTKNDNTVLQNQNESSSGNIFKETLLKEKQIWQKKQQQQNANNAFFTKKTKAAKSGTAKEKEIKANIEDLINKYTKEHKDLSTPVAAVTVDKQETLFVKFLKAVISFLIIAVAACIIIAFIMKPEINVEGEQIIEQIKKTEELYYAQTQRYHHFPKTTYDQTLGIDLRKYKYFMSYEVLPDEESGNYAAKAYGATNAFTITYYTVKAWLKNKQWFN